TIATLLPYTTLFRAQQARRVRIEKVELQDMDARKWRHFQEIDGGDADVLIRRPGHLGGDLRPASRRGAKINDAPGALEDLVLLVNLQQLECRAGAVALKLGALHIGIVDMTLDPPARRGLQLALLDLLSELPAGAVSSDGRFRHRRVPCSSRSVAGRCVRIRRHTPSSAIMSVNMPSRRRLSATRMRGLGQRLRIASRMAQPASTRSARSGPIQGLAARLAKSQDSSFACMADTSASDSQRPSTFLRS